MTPTTTIFACIAEIFLLYLYTVIIDRKHDHRTHTDKVLAKLSSDEQQSLYEQIRSGYRLTEQAIPSKEESLYGLLKPDLLMILWGSKDLAEFMTYVADIEPIMKSTYVYNMHQICTFLASNPSDEDATFRALANHGFLYCYDRRLGRIYLNKPLEAT